MRVRVGLAGRCRSHLAAGSRVSLTAGRHYHATYEYVIKAIDERNSRRKMPDDAGRRLRDQV